jgi:hypothetical protein
LRQPFDLAYLHPMAKFQIHTLSATDGSWDRFREDWQAQCDEVGDNFDDYAPDSLKVVAEIVAGTLLSVGGGNETRIGALWDEDSNRYYACCMLNLARLPNTEGRTLRIRHLLVSPLLDYGVAPVALYPDVLIGVLTGVLHLSETDMQAEHIRFHLRSPEDQAFFKAFGTDLAGSGVFASVQTFGAWLYITKLGDVSRPPMEESK